MNKFINLKKSCYISSNIAFLDDEEAQDFIRILLSKGIFHFYLTKKSLDSILINAIFKFKQTYPDILVFVVHSSKIPFWQQNNITNLPILANLDEDSSLKIWFKRYCEFIFEKKS